MDDITEMSPNEIIETMYADPDTAAEITAALYEVAEQAADYARQLAPVETGEYRDDINPHQEGNEVWLGFDSEIANLIEYGSVHNPEYAVARRTEEYFNRQ